MGLLANIQKGKTLKPEQDIAKKQARALKDDAGMTPKVPAALPDMPQVTPEVVASPANSSPVSGPPAAQALPIASPAESIASPTSVAPPQPVTPEIDRGPRWLNNDAPVPTLADKVRGIVAAKALPKANDAGSTSNLVPLPQVVASPTSVAPPQPATPEIDRGPRRLNNDAPVPALADKVRDIVAAKALPEANDAGSTSNLIPLPQVVASPTSVAPQSLGAGLLSSVAENGIDKRAQRIAEREDRKSQDGPTQGMASSGSSTQSGTAPESENDMRSALNDRNLSRDERKAQRDAARAERIAARGNKGNSGGGDSNGNGNGNGNGTGGGTDSNGSGGTDPATPSAPDPLSVPETGDSVISTLNGLLDSNSRYIKLARAAGERQAQERGLLNSSLAAGSSEAAAIAAAAPLASQDASIIAQRNQSRLEGDINQRNATSIQGLQDASAMERLKLTTASQEKVAASGESAAMARLKESIASNDRQAILSAETQLQASQIAANSQLTSTYLSALGQLSSNPEIDATSRSYLIGEYQRVTGMSQNYTQIIPAIPLTYSPIPAASGYAARLAL